MRRKLQAFSVITAGALAVSLTGMASPSAAGGAVTVNPGESIQDAIDAATPDTTITVLPGTYHENLVVTQDNIYLKGYGATLLPPATFSSDNPCGDPEHPDQAPGICVSGTFDAAHNLQHRTANDSVKGFTVKNFAGIGVFGIGVDHFTVEDTTGVDNGAYGIFSNTSVNSRLVNNKVSGSEEAGIYLGDSHDANAVIENNDTYDNAVGIFFRDSRSGWIRTNYAHDNCIGVLFLDTGEPGDDGAAEFVGNAVVHNNKACPPSDEAPPTSGAGVVLFGADDLWMQHNSITGNEASGPSFASGGLIIADSSQFGGSSAVNNRVQNNVIAGNSPSDLVFDSATTQAANHFEANLAPTSHVGL